MELYSYHRSVSYSVLRLEKISEQLLHVASSGRNFNVRQLTSIWQNRVEALAARERRRQEVAARTSSCNESWRPFSPVVVPFIPNTSFKPLPSLLRLERFHRHPRDGQIRFVADDHKYYLDEQLQFPVSVSGVWSRYFAKFDAVSTVDRYYDAWAANASSKYHEIIVNGRRSGTPDADIKTEIIRTWNRAGQVASAEGTRN